MKDTIPWTEWVKDRNVEPKVRDVRKRVLDDLYEANGKDSVDDLLNDIYLDKVTPCVASRKYVNELRDREIRPAKKLRPGTIGQWRSMLPEFWLSVLGKPNFDVETFDRIAPFKNTGTEIIKKAPTREELIHLLNIANPRDRALLAILCSGMRIGKPFRERWGIFRRERTAKTTIAWF